MSETDDIIRREVREAARILREDGVTASLTEVKQMVKDLESRIPGKELTPEEKAAAYDKLMAEKDKAPEPEPKKDGPEPPEPKNEPEPEPKPKNNKHWMFGDVE